MITPHCEGYVMFLLMMAGKSKKLSFNCYIFQMYLRFIRCSDRIMA